ncbi:MAG: hypothetical protein CSA22_07930 [Deltaproteobacteria bacterium]|nr:MAG: hypothetical protein CSA22_07930 [Deltaproteobacteria bacterium]
MATSKMAVTIDKKNSDMYLIAFKVDMPQQKALSPIKARGCAEKYQAKGKKMMRIGIGFSSEEKILQMVNKTQRQKSRSCNIQILHTADHLSAWRDVGAVPMGQPETGETKDEKIS